jgi:hypothetical protein
VVNNLVKVEKRQSFGAIIYFRILSFGLDLED